MQSVRLCELPLWSLLRLTVTHEELCRRCVTPVFRFIWTGLFVAAALFPALATGRQADLYLFIYFIL